MGRLNAGANRRMIAILARQEARMRSKLLWILVAVLGFPSLHANDPTNKFIEPKSKIVFSKQNDGLTES